MSVHPSLKASGSKERKSVLKRLEKLLHLIKKDAWKEGDSVFALPKIKVIKFKIKKEKTKEAEEVAATAAGETAATTGGPTPAGEAQKAQTPSTGKVADKGKVTDRGKPALPAGREK